MIFFKKILPQQKKQKIYTYINKITYYTFGYYDDEGEETNWMRMNCTETCKKYKYFF
jgi:hypothetical protein